MEGWGSKKDSRESANRALIIVLCFSQARKKSTKINFLGPRDRPVGWVASTPRGGGRKFRALPSKVCLPWVSKTGIWDVPGILPGCPGPMGCSKSLCKKKFVRIFRSLFSQGKFRGPEMSSNVGALEASKLVSTKTLLLKHCYHRQGIRHCSWNGRYSDLCGGSVPIATPGETGAQRYRGTCHNACGSFG